MYNDRALFEFGLDFISKIGPANFYGIIEKPLNNQISNNSRKISDIFSTSEI